jgi:hypothetical protein
MERTEGIGWVWDGNLAGLGDEKQQNDYDYLLLLNDGCLLRLGAGIYTIHHDGFKATHHISDERCLEKKNLVDNDQSCL